MAQEIPGPSPFERRIGSQLAFRIFGILLADDSFKVHLRGALRFVNTNNSGQHVHIASPSDTFTKEALRELLPDFQGTIVEFEAFTIDQEAHVATSPYGFIRGAYYNRAPNGLFYSFSNSYLLNLDGDAYKYESIQLERYGPGYMPFKTIPFVPKNEDSRITKLDPGDFEKIGSLTQQIENGEFRKL